MQDTLIIGAIMALPILTAIFLPFWASYQSRASQSNSETVHWQDQVDQMVVAVRDLDLDFDMGKVSEEDYILQRKMLIGRGVSNLLKLRDFRRQPSEADDELEQLILAYKAKY